jgi:amino acid permease
MTEIKIHDIKGLVEVPDYSLYIFSLVTLFAVIIICFIIYYLYKFFRNKKQNIRKWYFKKLQDIDLNSSKQSAYDITKYGMLLARTPREKQLLNDLIEKLKFYKYKKDVPSIDDETKVLFDIFMDSIDV